MIHTLYRRATHTFHAPSWVTSYLLLFFLSSSSLQFVFSEQLRFEHQLRSQLLWSKLVSRSIKRQRIDNNELQASSNQDQPINHASTKQAKQQGFKVPQTAGLQRAARSQLFASASVITGTLKPCSLHFNCNQSTRHQRSHGPKFTAIKGSWNPCKLQTLFHCLP